MLYKNLPKGVGLRRITLHKTMNIKQEVVYLLLVECSHFMDHIGEAANLLPILRARICGYTGTTSYPGCQALVEEHFYVFTENKMIHYDDLHLKLYSMFAGIFRCVDSF